MDAAVFKKNINSGTEVERSAQLEGNAAVRNFFIRIMWMFLFHI